jgi:hypothetical protein
MARLWGDQYGPPAFRLDGAPLEVPDAIASILSGDAVQRVVYAWALGRADSALHPVDKAEVRAALTATLGDGYPSIRWMAERSLRNLERELPLGYLGILDEWDHTDGARRDIFVPLFEVLTAEGPRHLAGTDRLLVRPDFSVDTAAIVDLLNRQADRIIDIGE